MKVEIFENTDIAVLKMDINTFLQPFDKVPKPQVHFISQSESVFIDRAGVHFSKITISIFYL